MGIDECGVGHEQIEPVTCQQAVTGTYEEVEEREKRGGRRRCMLQSTVSIACFVSKMATVNTTGLHEGELGSECWFCHVLSIDI